MPDFNKDREVFNTLVDNPQHVAAPQVMADLGIEPKDLERGMAAKQFEAKDPTDPRIGMLRNAIFDKIAQKRPAEEGFTTAGGGFLNRLVAKNIIDQDPNVQAQYYARKGFDTRFTEGNLEVKRPGQINFEAVDPKGIDIFDAFDVIGDVVEGIATTAAATTAGVLGGIGGGPAAPITGATAAAIAGGATTGLFEAGRQTAASLLGARDRFDPGQVGVATTIGAVAPTVLKGGGEALKGAGKLVGKGISKFQGGLKATAPQIEKAAEEIGAKATPGQLFDSRIVQELESAQFQSGGLIGGTGTRKLIAANQKATQDTADALVQAASNRSKFEVGDDVGKIMAEDLAEKLKPAEAIYQKLETVFKRKAYKPELSGLKKTFASLKKDLKFDKKGMSLVTQFEEQAKKIKNLDDLKKFRTALANEMGRDPLNKSNSQLIGRLYGPLTDARSDTLLKLAKGKGGDFFDAAKKDIEMADSIYKKSVGELENAILNPGKKLKGSPKKELAKFLESTPEIDRINKILRTNDPKKIAGVQKAFPKAFEELRKSKVAEIAEKSSSGGVVNPLKLAKKINAMPPETVKLVFGPNASKKAEALQIFLQNVPKPTGPSGTPRGMEVFRFRFLMDNLQSLRRDFMLNRRTKAQLDKGIFNYIGRILASPRTQAFEVARRRGQQKEDVAPPLLPPQAERQPLLIPQR